MLYSIGHGNRTWPEFLAILQSKNCKFLIDVRTFPKSKFNPSFNREKLSRMCAFSGLKYVFMGDLIGGRPNDKSLYDNTGRADYQRVKASKPYLVGISRIEKASRISENSFLMCSELEPSQCHRSKLIGQSLSEIGVELIHIDKNGMELSQDDVIRQIDNGQGDLFGESESLIKSRGSYR